MANSYSLHLDLCLHAWSYWILSIKILNLSIKHLSGHTHESTPYNGLTLFFKWQTEPPPTKKEAYISAKTDIGSFLAA